MGPQVDVGLWRPQVDVGLWGPQVDVGLWGPQVGYRPMGLYPNAVIGRGKPVLVMTA